MTSTTKSPGRSTWAASSVDCGVATRTPATRTLSERSAVAVEERLLAADAAQHAKPAAVSAPSAVSWPTSSRCSRCRSWSGLITTLSESVSTGTPSSTRRPSSVEVESRMTATTMYETMPPDEPRQDVEGAAGPQGVVRDGRDDLAGRELAPVPRRPSAHVVADDLGQPERRLQPVLDREAVAHHARPRPGRRRARRAGRRTGRARRCRRRRSPAGSPGRSRTASAPAPPSRRSRR